MNRTIALFALAIAVAALPLAAEGNGGNPSDSGSQGSDTAGSAEKRTKSKDASPGDLSPANYGVKDAKDDLLRLKLKPRELDKLREILEKDAPELERVRAGLRELQKRMVRLMVATEPDRGQIKATVRESLELELQMRMIQVDRHLAVRKLIGGERWASFYRLLRAAERGDLRDLLDGALESGEDRESLRALAEIFRYLR
ncbi:MAG: hypothetical protein NT080_05230 [Spirochaetes bacterium]|nr:hypothetical protein [Spirochaetota bacterium]